MNEPKQRPTPHQKRQERCIHFTGVSNETCKAGCSYKKLIGSLPCLPWLNLQKAKCDKYQAPTPEQVAEEEAHIQSLIDRMMKAGPLIKRIKTQHKGKSWSGVEECPVCKGRLHMSHAAYNGHVHGRCETENCLSWME